jgi:hypothetical protein
MKRVPAPATFGLAAALLAATLAGCSSSGPGGGSSAAALPPATGDELLSGVCPATVSIQVDWEPEAEHGAMYHLIGPDYTVDATHKRVSGPLVVAGKDTGVKVEVRAGGAAIGFTAIPAQMYIDKSITLGTVSTDGAINSSANQPTTAVVAPLRKSPQMLMWDPASHPDWQTIADIGASGAPVVVAKANFYSPLLVAKGLVKQSQLDSGYTGAPARFVTAPTIAQQGFATAEPYIYQHEVKSWGKPIKYQLLADVGYDIYPEPLAVRTGDLAALSPCLKRLVPIVQRSQADYLADPGPTNKLITDAVSQYNDGWTYSEGVAGYSATTMKQLGIVANDSSGPLGGMDMARVQSTIDTFAPILAGSGSAVRPGLKAADIATDQFLDPSIKLGQG